MTWYWLPCRCSTCSAATEASSSPSSWWDSSVAVWATSNGKPSVRASSWRGWKTRSWIGRLSGLRSSPSTHDRFVAEWTSSLPVSRAPTSPSPATSAAFTVIGGCGPTPLDSYAMWMPDTCSWRTSPDLFGSEDFPESSLTLPEEGSMRAGVVSGRQMSALRTFASASGSWPGEATTPSLSSSSEWPTPTVMGRNGRASDSVKSGDGLATVARRWSTPRASMNENRGTSERPSLANGHGDSLGSQAARWGTPTARQDSKSPEAARATKLRMGNGRTQITTLRSQALAWPTPRASDGERSSGSDPVHGAGGPSLRQAAVSYPTPKHRDWKADGSQASRTTPDLSAFLQGQVTTGGTGSDRADLNPSFVAALMGLPPGWLMPSPRVATASFRRWRRWHCGASSPTPGRRRRASDEPTLF